MRCSLPSPHLSQTWTLKNHLSVLMIVVLGKHKAKWELNHLFSFCYLVTSYVCPGLSQPQFLIIFFSFFFASSISFWERGARECVWVCGYGGGDVFRLKFILVFDLSTILLAGSSYLFYFFLFISHSPILYMCFLNHYRVQIWRWRFRWSCSISISCPSLGRQGLNLTLFTS